MEVNPISTSRKIPYWYILTLLTCSIVLYFFLSTLAVTRRPTFEDVPSNHWASEYIEWSTANGITFGVSDALYDPDGTLTRSQFITMVGRAMFNEQIARSTSTTDNWFSAHVRYMLVHYCLDNTDIANLYPYGEKLQREPMLQEGIPRSEMAVIIYNVCNHSGEEAATFGSSEIADIDLVDSRQAGSVLWCYRADLLQGFDDGKFHADKTVTRAQAATVLYRMMEYANIQPKDGYTIDAMSTERTAAIRDSLMAQINDYRTEMGVLPLVESNIMDHAAMLRAQELIENPSHQRPEGKGNVYEELTGSSLGYSEVIAGIRISPSLSPEQAASDILQAWKNSPEHDRILTRYVHPDYTQYYGGGIYLGSDNMVYACIQHTADSYFLLAGLDP